MYPQWILDNKDNYIYLLKKFNDYSTGSTSWSKCYTISDSSDKGLLDLKRKYNLNNLAIKNNEIERCLMAMEWTFQHLLFRNYSEFNEKLNAANILEFSRKNHKTVNCLCHATVLTEVLLSLGFVARKISCLPIDIVPFDNHVVTVVFIESLHKWIMLDPSMSCYITDKDGNILSLPEIRYNLINNKKICIETFSRFSTLSVTANKQFEFNQQEYIAYLYKNLFRFMSRSVQSSAATKNKDVFYMLVPKGFLEANTVQKSFVEDEEVELRITDDDEFFWNNKGAAV